MSEKTSIEWCDSTVNPVMGCAGCELWNARNKTCYAGQLHERRGGMKGFAAVFERPTLFPGRVRQAAGWSDLYGTKRTDKPWLNGHPRLVFVSDMGDALSERGAVDGAGKRLAGGGVPFDFLKREIVDVVDSALGRRHRWLWLTKRPGRLKRFETWLGAEHGQKFPPNLWLGTSVTSASTLGRVEQLRRCGDSQTMRFASIEPLWEEVSLAPHLRDIAWVIVGGESRQPRSKPREFDCDWARRVQSECQAAGVAFFVKQLGSNVIDDGRPLRLSSLHGRQWNEWPADLRVRQLPEKLMPKARTCLARRPAVT